MDPDKIKAALEAMKNGDGDAALLILEEMIASLAPDSADDSEGAGEVLADDPPDEETEELAAHPDDDKDKDEDKEMSALARATGHKSDAALAKSYKKLLSRVETLNAESAEIELGARRELVAGLVKLGVETPATAWEGDAEKRDPVKRLMSEPISELRARVDVLRAAHPAPIEAPSVHVNQNPLTQKELSAIKKRGISAEEFTTRKANAVRRSN